MVEGVFSKHLQVQIKNGDREDRRIKLKVSLEIITVTAPLQRKQMRIQITDDSDLFFLFTMKIDEEDFQHLKSQQGLLVDFPSFPQKLVELFERSFEEEDRESPKYILQFVKDAGANVATFSVVETNPFKHLTHLALRLVQGADTDVKQYLADCLKELKERNGSLESHLSQAESSLTATIARLQKELGTKTIDLERLQTEWNSRSSEIQSQHSREITEEQQRALKAQSSYQLRYEQERKDLEQAHMKIVKQLEARIYELDLGNKDLMEKKYKWESAVRDLTARAGVLEEENGRLKVETGALRKENSAMDGTCHKQDRKTQQLSTKVAVLEQQVEDKEALLNKSGELLNAEQEGRRRAEEEAGERGRHCSELEQGVQRMSEEIVKANEIIRKLQSENKHYHSKVKLRNEIALQQEKVLGEREDQLRKLKAELDSNAAAKRELSRQIGDTKQKYSELEKHLAEAKELNRTNENVINWLNKQVNEKQFLASRGGNSHLPALSHPGGRQPIRTTSAPGTHIPKRLLARSVDGLPSSIMDGSVPPRISPQPISESTPLSAGLHHSPRGDNSKDVTHESGLRSLSLRPPVQTQPLGSISSVPHSSGGAMGGGGSHTADTDTPLEAKYFERTEGNGGAPLRSIGNVMLNQQASPSPFTRGRLNLTTGIIKPPPLAALNAAERASLASSYFPRS